MTRFTIQSRVMVNKVERTFGGSFCLDGPATIIGLGMSCKLDRLRYTVKMDGGGCYEVRESELSPLGPESL